MILTGPEIDREVRSGAITIDPFNSAQLNPNSYNIRLASTIRVYNDFVLDCAAENETTIITMDDAGLKLEPERIYLGATVETIGSSEYVPILRARSSTARLGLFVHVTADLIDLGFFGKLTLQLHAVQGARIYPDMEIGQITFWRTQGEAMAYHGKYQGASGPVASKSYMDWGTGNSGRPGARTSG